MITAFVGVPGSGKTYEAVEKIVDNIRLGRKIYTNINGLQEASCRAAIAEYCNVREFQLETCLNHLTEDQAVEFWLHAAPGSLVIIDEVHKLFSNREWQTAKNKHFTEWASTHRHEGYDVVLITQDLEKIDKHCRTLVEYVYLYSKVNFLGKSVNNTYICYTYHGDSHVGKPMFTNKRTYDQKIFPCYKSYVADDVMEQAFMKKPNILNHPVFYALGLAICLTGYFAMDSGILSGEFLKPPEVGVANAAQEETTVETNIEEQGKVETVSLPQEDGVQENLQPVLVLDETKLHRWKTKGGSIVWTNNTIVPPDSEYIDSI
jgi:zona occludens toxin (predicted ATPase)